jgi:hypothetical protein
VAGVFTSNKFRRRFYRNFSKMSEQTPHRLDARGKRELLSAGAAVRVAVQTVGGWLAATIFLLTISNALPAALHKICRATNRNAVRITNTTVPVRVDRRVDVIEPDRLHGLAARSIRVAGHFAAAEAATILAAQDDQHRATARRNLPFRAAPFLARADLIGPLERHPLSSASPDASAQLQPASFPPRFNRPPPFAC